MVKTLDPLESNRASTSLDFPTHSEAAPFQLFWAIDRNIWGAKMRAITSGMEADFVATQGNTVEGIAAVRKFVLVMKYGKVSKNSAVEIQSPAGATSPKPGSTILRTCPASVIHSSRHRPEL